MDQESKILKLLETIAADGVDLKKGQSTLEKHIDKLELRMENTENQFNNLDLRMANMENNIDKLDLRMANMENNMNKVEMRMENTEKHIDKLELRMENEVIDKVRALFDAREVQNDVNECIITTLARIEGKVDILQVETASIRRVK